MLDPTPHGDLDRRAIADQAAADKELRALLRQLKDDCGMTYEQLAEAAMLSRGTVQNYVAKPGHGRDTATLKHLLAKLRASEEQRAQALRLHQRTLPAGVDPAAAGWLTRARPAEVTVWSMAQFSATEASVHTAIGRRHRTAHEGEQIGDMATPAYVPRAHDAPLRRDIKQAAVGELQALIVMRGTSSTGKTRSLFEAVHEICPDWMVVRPRSAAAARRLPESRLFDRPCVVWLNELQGFLGPNGYGLSLDVLRDLYAAATAPVVLVGTLWPDKLRDASIARDERTSDTRDLLAGRTPWVRWHEVPRTLTTESERAAARERAVADPRLARAVADHDGFGFAQTLAGAHELLEKYQNAPRPAQLLLDAAAEARRLGHSHALTAPLLRAVSLALWREDHGPTKPPNRWYDDAIAYAAAPVRSDDGVRALIPLDDPDNPEDADEPVGYDLADYLEQHLTRVRRMRRVSDLVWERLRYHTTQPDDLMALAVTAAERYARFDHAEALLRTAASAGAPQALTWLAGWLSDRPAREDEVESTFRGAAASGAPGALHGLAGWLRRQPRREAEAEATYREAAESGQPRALFSLAEWLRYQRGREAEAEALYREAGLAGVSDAAIELARWLQELPGRKADAEAAYREAAANGSLGAWRDLAEWLHGRPGREADAMAAYRKAALSGDLGALRHLSWRLHGYPAADIEAIYREIVASEDVVRKLAASGDLEELRGLARWLGWQPSRQADAEAAYREAAARGDRGALRELAKWLHGRPRREADAEAAYREAAMSGDLEALRELARWLRECPGREVDAQAAYREIADVDGPRALLELAEWLYERPGRKAEAEAIYREAASRGLVGRVSVSAVISTKEATVWNILVGLLEADGREEEVEQLRSWGLDANGATAAELESWLTVD